MTCVPYKPLLAAMRRPGSSPAPRAELDKVVARAILKQDWRRPTFRATATGLLDLLPAGATGVKVTELHWSDGDLTIVARDLIGLRCPDW